MRMGLLLALTLMLGYFACADGMIIPPEPEDPFPLVLNHYVNITVDDTYATFEVDQEFMNDGYRDIQGTYVFPVPSGSIKNFQIVVDGKVIEGRLLDKDEAGDLYREYVLERKEASLLEYSGLETFSASVLLKRGEKVRVQISYDQVIAQSSGVYSVFYPLSPERYTTKPIDPVDISVDIRAAGDIGFVMSPTHNISVSRGSGKHVVVDYYSKEIPDRDFQVFYGVTSREYDVKAIANKKMGEDGYFMLFIYPSSPGNATIPKDVVYVLDVSGSMRGSKMEQAKRALKYGLGQLADDDRFNIITFSSNAEDYKRELVGVGSRQDAKRFVDSLEAVGATNIEDALVLASEKFSDDDRLHLVVLLTDGEDTTGHSVRSIMNSVEGCDCKIFPFGVGTDIDFELLNRISNEHGDGIPVYIRGDTELESSLTMFYDKISRPLLTDVGVEISGDGLEVYDSYPKKVPDVFYGSQIVIMGRYSGAGTGTAMITGKEQGKDKTFTYGVGFPSEDRNSFVERMWATRKVGYLLDVIALEGETEELKGEVIALATKYGIPSPYTSYVAVNEEGETVKRSIDIADAAGGWGPEGNIMTTASVYKAADSYAYAPPSTKTAGDKTFIEVDGLWKDTSCGDEIDQTVGFGSEEYLSLVQDDELAKYFSVGNRVWVCTDRSILVSTGETEIPSVGETTGSGANATVSGDGEQAVEAGVLERLLPVIALMILAVGIAVSIMMRGPRGELVEIGHNGEDFVMYKTLSSETRMSILKVLGDCEGGRTTTYISGRIGKSKATVSEHLDKLVKANLIEKDHAEGRKWVFYKLTPVGRRIVRKAG